MISDDDLVKIARSGNHKAAERLLERFSQSADRNDPLLSYFAEVFEEILKGVGEKKALNLARPRGRRRDRSSAKSTETLHLGLLVQEYRNEGKTYQEAVADTAEGWDVSESKVRRCYKKLVDDGGGG